MKKTYSIDPAHSGAHFTVRHMMITNVRGSFKKVTGTVVYDPENPADTSIQAEIDASSISTNDDQRDAHLRSADFLDVAKFPTITFRSTKVQPDSESEWTVTGDLTIHGVTRPVVLKVDAPGAEAKDPWGNLRMGASATTKIKRSDFGLSWNAALEAGGLLVGDEVKIELELSLVRSADVMQTA
jgi:polyisoprenoid-binding protein YceI